MYEKHNVPITDTNNNKQYCTCHCLKTSLYTLYMDICIRKQTLI